MRKEHDRGQALAETALVAVLYVVVALGLLNLIVAHRARTVAVAAARACVEFATQVPENPEQGAIQGILAARRTFEGDWSESAGVGYGVRATAGGPGRPATCTVTYRVPGWFGFGPPSVHEVTLTGRVERWKARWP